MTPTPQARLSRGSLIALSLAVGGSACGAGPDRADSGSVASVRDSAGIEIVSSSAPLWAEGEGWVVDSVPTLQIGEVEGAEAYLFQSIGAAFQVDGGRVAILESATLELRVFGPDGSFLNSIGRRGEGPGEFGAPPVFAIAPPDTIIAYDLRFRRLNRFSIDGTLISEEPLGEDVAEAIGASAVREFRLAPDGTLAMLFDELPEGARESTDPYHTTSRVVSTPDGLGRALNIGPLPGRERVQRSAGMLRLIWTNPFDPYPQFDVAALPGSGAHRVVVAGGARWEVLSYLPDGSLERIARVALSRDPIDDAAIARYDEDSRRSWDGWERQSAEVGADIGPYQGPTEILTFPDSAPGIVAVTAVPDGHLWITPWDEAHVFEEASDPKFEVLDPDGRWLGRVTVPSSLGQILEIGADFVLAAWEDELGVQFLRRYRIVKGG